MMTIHEVSKLAGVSVRTLHHYDAIGLLPPTALTEAGYRLDDDKYGFGAAAIHSAVSGAGISAQRHQEHSG